MRPKKSLSASNLEDAAIYQKKPKLEVKTERNLFGSGSKKKHNEDEESRSLKLGKVDNIVEEDEDDSSVSSHSLSRTNSKKSVNSNVFKLSTV